MKNYYLINKNYPQNKISISQIEFNIGREIIYNCNDKRISRNHATVSIIEDEIVITSTHDNPIFYRSSKNLEILEIIKKNSSTILTENDEIGFLPDDFWFRVSNNSEDFVENSSIPNQIVFRVRNIEEINADGLDQTNSSTKRKFPNWFENVHNDNEPSTSSIIDSSNKKQKTSIENENLINNTVNENQNPVVDSNTSDDNLIAANPISNSNEENDNAEEEKEVDSNTSDDNLIAENPISNSNEENDNADEEKDVKVKVEADSSSNNVRTSCQYGIRCYRRNPIHRLELAHPGDTDYRRPDLPPAPDSAPDCPYGDQCYRRNPIHFKTFKHPPSTDPKLNRKRRKAQMKNKKIDDQGKRKRKTVTDVNYGLDNDEYDLEDPFIDDSDSDLYQPSEDETEDDDIFSSEED